MLSGLLRTSVRFPLTLACALAWAGIAIGLEHGIDRGETKVAEQLQVLFLLGFFWTLAATLFAERRGWPVLWHLPLAAAGLALLALRVLTGPQTLYPLSNPTVLPLGPGMVLLMMAAPFLSAKSDDAALWNFNRAGWVSAAFGLLVAVIVGIGLTLAFGAVEELLVELPNRVYTDTWVLCMSVIWPWQALSGVPRSFDRPEGDFCPRWLGFLISYVLVPLASLYLAILYLYMAKILVQWELPKGQVGWMVSGYGTFGVATHVLTHPLRDTGNRLVRLFHRHFYHALFAPVALLVVAVGVRIDTYGITENRYCLLLFAVWLGGMALVFTFRKTRRLVMVPLSLAVLLVAASFGPWGASGLSTLSQMGRLERLLAANGLLVEGRIVAAERPADREQLRRISALVNYFSERGKLEDLRDRLTKHGGQFEHDSDKFEIMAALGLEYVLQRNESFYFDYTAASGNTVDVSDFEVMTSLTLSGSESHQLSVEGITRTYEVVFDREAGTLAIRNSTGDSVLFDLAALAKRLRQEADSRRRFSAKLMSLEGTSGTLRAQVFFQTLNGGVEDGISRVTYADATILIGQQVSP